MKKEKQDQIKEEAIRALAQMQSMGLDDLPDKIGRGSYIDPSTQEENEKQIRNLLEPGSSSNLEDDQEEPLEIKKVVIVMLAAIGTVGVVYAIFTAI